MVSERRVGVILSYISIVAGVLISLVYTPFMLRKLGQAEYGLFSLVNTTMSYLTILDFGLGNTIVRYSAKYRELGDKDRESSLYGMFLILYIGIGIIAFAAGSVISANSADIFQKTLLPGQESTVKTLTMIAAFNIAVSFPLGIFSSMILGYEKYFFSNLLGLIQKILTPLTMAAVLFAGLGSVGMLFATAAINIVLNLIRMFFALSGLKLKVRFRGFDFGIFKEIITFSFFIFLSIIVDKLFWGTDQVILGIEGTSMSDVAAYSLAATFVSAFITIASVIGHMYLPQFTKMTVRKESDERISEEFIRVSRLQFFVCMLMYGGFIIIGKRFITELYAGPGYADTYIIALIIISSVVTGITQNVGISVLQAKNMHKFRAFIQLAIAVLNVVLTIFAVRAWGAVGAAAMTFISYFLGVFIAMSVYYQKKAGLNVVKLWSQLLRILIKYAVLIGVFLILNKLIGWRLSPLAYTLIWGAAYVFSYFIITYCWCMNKYEKDIVNNLLSKILKKTIKKRQGDNIRR